MVDFDFQRQNNIFWYSRTLPSVVKQLHNVQSHSLNTNRAASLDIRGSILKLRDQMAKFFAAHRCAEVIDFS